MPPTDSWVLPHADIFEEPLSCVAINQDWLKIISGSLGDLLEIAAWEANSPDDIARIRASVASLAAEFSKIEDCGMGCFRMRENPDFPGCIQTSCDDGGSWQDAYCLPGVVAGSLQRMTDNGHIEYSQDGGETWLNGDIFDPRFAPDNTPLLGAPASTCVAAENVAARSKELSDKISELIASTATAELIVGGIITFISYFFGFAVPVGLVTSVVQVILNTTQGQWDDAIDEDAINQFKCIVFCALDDNPPSDKPIFSVADYDYIVNRTYTEMDVIANLYFSTLVKISGTAGLNIGSRIGVTDGTSCDDCDCPICALDIVTDFEPNSLVYLGDCSYQFDIPPMPAEIRFRTFAEDNFVIVAHGWTNPGYVEQYSDVIGGTLTEPENIVGEEVAEYVLIANRDFPIRVTFKVDYP